MNARPKCHRVPASPEEINTLLSNLRKAVAWLVDRQFEVLDVQTNLGHGAPCVIVARPPASHTGSCKSVRYGCTIVWEETPCA